jgi:hypothetical protein
MHWWPSFVDELGKIAAVEDEVALTPEEKRREALQFAGLGMATVPLMQAASSKVMTGRWLPKDVRFRRWLPAALAGGLFWGGAMPAIRHGLSRANIQGARNRYNAQQELRSLGKRNVESVIKKAPEAMKLPGGL